MRVEIKAPKRIELAGCLCTLADAVLIVSSLSGAGAGADAVLSSPSGAGDSGLCAAVELAESESLTAQMYCGFGFEVAMGPSW